MGDNIETAIIATAHPANPAIRADQRKPMDRFRT
jgi:hypothetical protein